MTIPSNLTLLTMREYLHSRSKDTQSKNKHIHTGDYSTSQNVWIIAPIPKNIKKEGKKGRRRMRMNKRKNAFFCFD